VKDRPRARTSGPAARGEAGFALVEVMVSAVLLIVLALAMLPVLDISASRAGTNRSRSVASNLAKDEQQRMRSLDVSQSLSNYRGTQTKTVAGVDYTVTSRTDWVRDDSGQVSCTTDKNAVQYLKLTTTVTWPRMNGTQPVLQESLLASPVGEYGTNVGTLVVQVSKADGSPAPGLSVGAAGLSDVTNALGCAVFANVTAGSTVVNLSSPGWVTPAGAPAISDPVTVVAGQTTLNAQQYDVAGTVPVTFDTRSQTDASVVASKWRSVTASHSALLTPRRFGSGSTDQTQILATPLFPFTSGYTIYAGNCAGNDPAAYQTNYFASNAGLMKVPPGTTTAPVAVRTPTITVGVQRRLDKNNATAVEDLSTAAAQAANSFAPHVVIRPDLSKPAMAGCAEKEDWSSSTPVPQNTTAQVFSFAISPTQTILAMKTDIPMPFGTWNVCVDDGRHSVTTSTANTDPNGSFALPVIPAKNASGTSVCT
jgi:Tfp pilus assembly protein PilV